MDDLLFKKYSEYLLRLLAQQCLIEQTLLNNQTQKLTKYKKLFGSLATASSNNSNSNHNINQNGGTNSSVQGIKSYNELLNNLVAIYESKHIMVLKMDLCRRPISITLPTQKKAPVRCVLSKKN